jgi:hypothetical protein
MAWIVYRILSGESAGDFLAIVGKFRFRQGKFFPEKITRTCLNIVDRMPGADRAKTGRAGASPGKNRASG